ncbi:MAG: iron ABC transporter [Candidatus Syntrophoarchaeum caldarius]|uniref:Cobalamin import system permease protein BtuC n=1 Tax=Candidatus Syntropharchaeum caldarium TaxID=1838285 RepID=A0A1F2PAK4_9EURY|nr:MAG: iron ABC transporter [Candidatus Syntrophoarchaeum caldarius]
MTLEKGSEAIRSNSLEPFSVQSLDAEENIFFNIRLPRVIFGILVGIALAVAGGVMQGVFKNPMADPFILGISTGSAVGAVLGMTFFASLGLVARPFMAFLGGVVTIFIVYNIARAGGKIAIDTLLLAGIAFGYFLYSLEWLLLIVFTNSPHEILSWLIGYLGTAQWQDVKYAVLPVLTGTFIIFLFARDLNAMLLGDETAHYLGIGVENVRKILLVLASLITAITVAFSGIIGFVGLIIPHTTRLLVGSDHRILLPASALFGAIFVIWTDTLARTVLVPSEIPVGVITPLFGAPLFIYLLVKKRRG